MPQISRINVSLTGEVSAALDLEAVTSRLGKVFAIELGDGAGLNQAANIFSDQRVLGASANETLDLNGVLANGIGQILNFTKVKALAIFAADTNVNDVVVGNAASNGFVAPFNGSATATAVVKPGGCLLLVAPSAAGFAVVAGTADQLRIANGGAGSTVTYDIVIIGA